MKNTKKKYPKSRILDTVHDMAKGLYDDGVIDSTTLREYDALCLPKIKELSAKEIKKIRLHEKVSQAIFAKFLNTSVSTVRHWEQGDRHPRGTSLKLLNLIADKGLDALT
jgi:putative transcriptional regulator